MHDLGKTICPRNITIVGNFSAWDLPYLECPKCYYCYNVIMVMLKKKCFIDILYITVFPN